TVADNACENCHRPHAAGHGSRLLAQTMERVNCTICHRGQVAAKNVDAEFSKFYRHPVDFGDWTHEPNENPFSMPRHVACEDCHNPHATSSAGGGPLLAAGALRGVRGITRSGSPVAESAAEYQICFKCHGLTQPATLGVTRQSVTRN